MSKFLRPALAACAALVLGTAGPAAADMKPKGPRQGPAQYPSAVKSRPATVGGPASPPPASRPKPPAAPAPKSAAAPAAAKTK
jgi:hypothetical protein